MSKIVSACTLHCQGGCSLVVTTSKTGKISIKGNPDHPFTRGITCARPAGFLNRLQSSHRITVPLIRYGSSFRAISWEEALDQCARRIQHYRSSPTSILHLKGFASFSLLGQASSYVFGRIGATTTRGGLCNAAGARACVEDFGLVAQNPIFDLLNARRIVNWGRNLSACSPHEKSIVQTARKSGTKVLSLCPGDDGYRSFSDEIIRLRPGTDRFLAAAVIRLIMERKGVPGQILETINNWPSFKALVESFSLEELSTACNVTRDQIERVYSWYDPADPVATLIGLGMQRHAFGGENVRFINALGLLAGQVGRTGGGVYYQPGLCPHVVQALAWAAPPAPPARTFRIARIGPDILENADPAVNMVWIDGVNVVTQSQDSTATQRALQSCEFTVVVDAFMTDTALCADLILPSALMLEKEDVSFGLYHEYLNYAAKVFDPPGLAKSDFEIMTLLGERLDPPILLPTAEQCYHAVLTASGLPDALSELKVSGFAKGASPSIAYEGLHFGHADGKCCLSSHLHKEPEAAQDYPLRLLSLIEQRYLHSQIPEEEQESPPKIWISPDNPAITALDMNKPVFLVTPLGRLQVAIGYMKDLHPEAVVYRRGNWIKCGGGINRLIEARLTDLGEQAAYYAQHVRLENA